MNYVHFKAKQFVISRGNIKNVIDKEVKHCILYVLGEVAWGVILRCLVCDNNRLLPEALDVKAIVSKNKPFLCIDCPGVHCSFWWQ